jgi:hypothetical protein
MSLRPFRLLPFTLFTAQGECVIWEHSNEQG